MQAVNSEMHPLNLVTRKSLVLPRRSHLDRGHGDRRLGWVGRGSWARRSISVTLTSQPQGQD